MSTTWTAENPSAFWQDDAWEVEVNADHTPTEEHNLEGEPANNFSYKWAVPPVEGAYQFYRPVSALEWLVDGSEWVDFGWGYDGEQFGESTYYYELAITPLTSLPNDASATPDQAVVFDLEENEIIHTSVTVGDFDEACTECVTESYQGFWTMSPEMCCTGTNGRGAGRDGAFAGGDGRDRRRGRELGPDQGRLLVFFLQQPHKKAGTLGGAGFFASKSRDVLTRRSSPAS